MKKFIFALAAVAAVAFAGCSKENEEEQTGSQLSETENRLVGKWEVYKVESEEHWAGQTYYGEEEYGSNAENRNVTTFERNRKGTIETWYRRDYTNGWEKNPTERFTWSLSGNVLTIAYDDGGYDRAEVKTLTDDRLVLVIEYAEDDWRMIDNVYYNKVK